MVMCVWPSDGVARTKKASRGARLTARAIPPRTSTPDWKKNAAIEGPLALIWLAKASAKQQQLPAFRQAATEHDSCQRARFEMASFALPKLPDTGDKFGPPNDDVYAAVPEEFRGIPFAPFAKVRRAAEEGRKLQRLTPSGL